MNKRKVECYDLEDNYIKTYDSYSDAAKDLNCDEATIRRSAKFGRPALSKYWFIDEEPKEIQINTTYELVNPVKFDNNEINVKSGPKIILLDIETAPLRSYTWGLWKQNVGLNQIISNWYMLSWSVKYVGEPTIFYGLLRPEEALREEDYRIMLELWEHLDNADIVIAHNGDKFDIPKINTRFLIHEMIPPSPYKQIDTLTVARNQFGFSSNRLDHLAQLFGIEMKMPTSFDLWKECMVGNSDALEYMSEYNRHDVKILEEVYLRMRPWIKSHPNLDLYHDTSDPVCPLCGGKHLEPITNKYFFTQAVRYNIFRCKDCGGISRSKKGLNFVNKKVISPIPK